MLTGRVAAQLRALPDRRPAHHRRDERRARSSERGQGKRTRLRARVISFGVGYDVNSRLLDRLSRECFGQSEYVRPNEDIEEHVAGCTTRSVRR